MADKVYFSSSGHGWTADWTWCDSGTWASHVAGYKDHGPSAGTRQQDADGTT